MICWHKWKKTKIRIREKNFVSCCGKTVSSYDTTVTLKECEKCGKIKGWKVYDDKFKGLKLQLDKKEIKAIKENL